MITAAIAFAALLAGSAPTIAPPIAEEGVMSPDDPAAANPAAGLWRIEGARDRCRISLMKTPAAAGTLGVLVEGCEGHRLAVAARWRMAQGEVELQDAQGRALMRLAAQGPDALAGPDGLRLTRAPEA